MRHRLILYIGLFLLLGGGAVFVGRMAPSRADTPQTASAVFYLAVTRDCAAGSFLEANDLEWRPLAAEAQRPSSVLIRKEGASIENIAGVVLRAPLREGQFVSTADFIRPGDAAFLAAVLKPGSRAVTIRVDDVTGGAGLIRPGNVIDVILSGRLDASAAELPSARTLLRNVRIIAVNRDTEAGPAQEKAADRSPVRSSANKGTVTLEVSPKEVELLVVARDLGTLSLSLRSLSAPDHPGENAEGELTRASDLLKGEKSFPKRQVTSLFGTEQR